MPLTFSNNGKIARQSVLHFHMHVTPRYPDDEIKFVLQRKQYAGTAMAEYTEKKYDSISSEKRPGMRSVEERCRLDHLVSRENDPRKDRYV